jgi:hypothetical protein
MVLDGSFAALDPENLHCALECGLRSARSLPESPKSDVLSLPAGH